MMLSMLVGLWACEAMNGVRLTLAAFMTVYVFFGMRLEEELANFSQARNHPEADASVRSLKRAGYYVGIARKSRAAHMPRAAERAVPA